MRHGLPESTALRAVGLDAAKVLGVDQRVGSLQAGKDADFLVLSGDPFAVEDGHVTVTDTPGWGVEVAPDWLDGAAYADSRWDGAPPACEGYPPRSVE